MKRLILLVLFGMQAATAWAQAPGTNEPLPGTREPLAEGDYTYRTNEIGQAAIVAFNKDYSGALLITNALGECPVTAIGKLAFQGHVGLTSVTIPNSVTSIGDWAFCVCSNLVSLAVAEDNSVHSSLEGVLFNKNQTELLHFPAGRAGDYAIPSGVTNIGRAFSHCARLSSVKIPESVKKIAENAFRGCASLTALELGSGVADLGAAAFFDCKSLTSVTIPNSVTSIGACAFYNCTGLTTATIPNSVTSIAHRAFYNCTSLTSVAIPNSVSCIEPDTFEGCTCLTSVRLPDGLNSIANQAFLHCASLSSVTIPDSVNSIGSWAFYYTGPTNVTIGSGFTNRWSAAFFGCTNLQEIMVAKDNPAYSSLDGVLFNRNQTELIQFPEGRTGHYAIPDSVTSIGGSAFRACTRLPSITIPNSATNIGFRAFWGCSSLITLTIPNSVTTIGTQAFHNCYSLTNVVIGRGVTRIEHWAFNGCTNLEEITVAEDNPIYSSLEGVLFNKNQTELLYFPKGRVGSFAIPASVTNIGNSELFGCPGLIAITVDERNSTYSSVDGVLFDKNWTTIIVYPAGKAGSYAIPDSVTRIGRSAFNNCMLLSGVTIPPGITSIGEGAFSFCTNLVNLTIPASVTNIGFGAFAGCIGLTNLPASVGVTRPPRADYQARRRQRMVERSQQPAQPAKPAYTPAELKEHLQKYQMEVIRQGLPPMPVTLTPESEAQLAREGIVPPPPAQSNPPIPASTNGTASKATHP